MTRDEAKQLMRLELERDLPADKRGEKVFPFQNRMLSANDMMAEVETDTDLGKVFLDDFIAFKNNGSEELLTAEERAYVISLMEDDLKVAPKEWADTPLFTDGEGSWTPNKIMAQVRAETEFGLRYMQLYYMNHRLLEGLFGKNYLNYPETTPDPFGFSFSKKNHNDKAN